MTDSAIPMPDDAQAILDRHSAVTRSLAEAFAPVLQAVHDAAEVGMATMRKAVQQMEQRRRVHAMMPTLTVRGVLLHGYVRFEEA